MCLSNAKCRVSQRERPWMAGDCPHTLPRSWLTGHQPPAAVSGRRTVASQAAADGPGDAEPVKDIGEKTGSAPLPLLFPALLLGDSVCPARKVSVFRTQN